MKKTCLVFLLVASIILSIATISVTAIDDDVYFVNGNGVEITFLNYQKLLSVGYTDREIQSISLDEYNQIAQMEILSIEKDDYYIKTVTVENEDGTVLPKIKISENVGKITTPHYKKLYRFFGRDTGKAIADYLCVYDETVDDSRNMEIFDPDATWKRKNVYNFEAKELQVPIFKNGELVYTCPALEEIRTYCLEQVDKLWDEVKRFDNPHTYYVDLSQKLWDVKYGLLKENNIK